MITKLINYFSCSSSTNVYYYNILVGCWRMHGRYSCIVIEVVFLHEPLYAIIYSQYVLTFSPSLVTFVCIAVDKIFTNNNYGNAGYHIHYVNLKHRRSKVVYKVFNYVNKSEKG